MGFAALAASQALVVDSAHAQAQQSQARLIGGARAPDGSFRAAITLDLPPGAVTYWLNPGDSGVSPEFDYSESENLGRVETRLPAPMRITHAGEEVFGYRDHVAFYVHAEAKQADGPPKLILAMNYAICDKLCIPAQANLELDLTAAVAPEAAKRVDDAERALPQRAPADAFLVQRQNTGDAVWLVCAKNGEKFDDLFPYAANDLFETQPQADGSFLLRLVDGRRTGPRSKIPPVALTFTKADGAVETVLDLNGSPAGDAPSR